MITNSSYVADFITATGHIQRAIAFEAADDDAAAAVASKLLQGSDYRAVEVYHGRRFVARREPISAA